MELSRVMNPIDNPNNTFYVLLTFRISSSSAFSPQIIFSEELVSELLPLEPPELLPVEPPELLPVEPPELLSLEPPTPKIEIPPSAKFVNSSS